MKINLQIEFIESSYTFLEVLVMPTIKLKKIFIFQEKLRFWNKLVVIF